MTSLHGGRARRRDLLDAVASSYLCGTRELMLNDSVLVAPEAERRHARPGGNLARRAYPDVLEARRTSCPQLPVWEEANDRGFIVRHRAPERGALVWVSDAGKGYLRTHSHPATV